MSINPATHVADPRTPIEKSISERPEVHEVELHRANERDVILVTFEGRAIPAQFAEEYDIELVTAYCWDPRPLWKLVVGWGPTCRLVGHFVRDREDWDLQDSNGGSD